MVESAAPGSSKLRELLGVDYRCEFELPVFLLDRDGMLLQRGSPD
ncbi:MAG: hypothetical protein U5J83_00785 [Bryobacterales bacterium]|nr:hypothetical protein [Bryobacterales bacterium]